MADYVFVENYSKIGKMGISHVVFDQIAAIATTRVKDAIIVVDDKKLKLFKLRNPVSCVIRNGVVNVNVEMLVNQRANVNNACLKIQEEVSNAISGMTEIVPFNVNVKVVGVYA